jgi:uncharacterized protein YaiE (UPF0345 family)
MNMSELLTYVNSDIYFEGKVLLRNFIENGMKLTMGFMAMGEFNWLAEEQESFHIIDGDALFVLPDGELKAISGTKIVVSKGVKFRVIVQKPLDYRCYYG